jgi:putative transposase
MARIPRVVIEGIAFHITQRGNGRQQVFRCSEDYNLYLDLLEQYATDARLLPYA